MTFIKFLSWLSWWYMIYYIVNEFWSVYTSSSFLHNIIFFFIIRVIAECITCQFLIYSRSGFLLVNVICLQCMKDGGYFSLIEVIFHLFKVPVDITLKMSCFFNRRNTGFLLKLYFYFSSKVLAWTSWREEWPSS